LKLIRIAGLPCDSAGCPTIFTEGDDVVVQGYPVDPAAAGIEVPAGELLVRIPRDLLREGAARLQSN
jgi:hypothetical protein